MIKIANIIDYHFKLNIVPQHSNEAYRIWKRVINVRTTALGLICSNN
ncbi:hypothetical protein YPPY66_2747 [Yersinia pestis PY-66]|uniref:Uncharacterized protein n=1 Tax=Yersinia pestis PY-08 TaxID=992134 RepID=A0AB72ZJP6_YERPE|nr:hypothetical protein YpB42003004_1555 [Yersinia pestis biovar Antiqua str. B42003004]EIQ88257.1 hypothetical protein YPPY01_2450 [Yersinia pestis PY-01]EIQ90592.1 hypothetical protein YPPY03_2532 [Yersinia pestis PY-03]EIR01880.1 hypothetical protein YPPY04_2517 [Yersinia pestis PY-04]EIR03515.1 hypothetical protein YPPY05_2482 [Yersinia pestis PY-05]EIR06497.1 hypothetical protein YPPY06_2544 [Yersinia pestis PY-06]EIR17391.1 hypothetical protein YPPY07_2411 [Yersinia pestis PY-07]EIR183